MVTRLTGGDTPADGGDPRTFPSIFDEAVDELERLESAKADDPHGNEAHGATFATEGYVDSVASETSTVEEATTSRTLQLSDKGKIVECTHADPTTVTVPPNSSVAFPVGTLVGVYAAGAGGVTIAEGTGVTIRNLAAVDQYGEASLRKRGTDEWVQA